MGETVPLSVGFSAMCKNRERKAENRVGGAVAVSAGVETVFLEGAFEWSSPRPALIVDSRRRKSPGGLGIGVAGGAGVGGRATGSGNGSDPSLNSQTNCRKGLQKYKACNIEFA